MNTRSSHIRPGGFFQSLEILSCNCYCHSMALSPTPYPNSKFPIWSLPLICLIVTAFASILLFTCYRIVKQICYGHYGESFRDWVERQLLDEANPDDPSQQFHSRGLDSSTVYSLPIAQFKKNEGPSHSNTDCAVCLGEFEEGEFLKHLPNCSHVFHIPCIDTWFESHSNCPLCRTHVYDFTMDNEFSGSMYTLLETLRREDFFQEWVENYQILRVEILQTSTHRQEPENGT